MKKTKERIKKSKSRRTEAITAQSGEELEEVR